MILVNSPNCSVKPSTAKADRGHLYIGGMDVVDLAQEYGTPLWIIDEQTVLESIKALKMGLADYPECQILYAGKAFLCLAMCHLINKEKLGLDVVSAGEIHTAISAKFPAESLYLHGNNKSAAEITAALHYGDARIVIDNESELHMVAEIANGLNKKVKVFLRVVPDIEPDTHQHIVTGHAESKFGFALQDLIPVVQRLIELPSIELVGLHTHIGSQALAMDPYFEIVNIMADCYADLKNSFNIELHELDIGGGLGISYTTHDVPTPVFDWAKKVSDRIKKVFGEHKLKLPKLMVEPGRAIIGTAGITVYTAGHKKRLPSGTTYLAVDGGMADNPRPITYDAKYTAVIASRMDAPIPDKPLTIVGKYCESGDIIVKEAYLSAESGDLLAVFGTGAYNFSMSSNYNRTPRPACLLLSSGKADVIIERESNEDLLRHDRVPERLR